MAGSWKRNLRLSNRAKLLRSGQNVNASYSSEGYRNYRSYLPEVYTGQNNRVERYGQYEWMDQSTEINSALDIIAEFCTQSDDKGQNFDIKFMKEEDPSNSEAKVLNELLESWINLNDFNKKLFKIIRDTLKFGDQFFIRDPETLEWYWQDHAKVEKVIVNEALGKEPEQYIVRDLALNLQNKVVSQPLISDNVYTAGSLPSTGYITGSGANTTFGIPAASMTSNSRFQKSQTSFCVDAKHVVHLSLSLGLDINWPFGTSILERVFKVYKQKELLEDSIIIYRVQRAPERRVFYLDTGNMPPHKAMQYIERVKNEIHQRRIPSRDGRGGSVLDATYSPHSILEDFFFAINSEGRGSRVETLPAGENLGTIDDLKYFQNQLLRGLRVPVQYLSFGPEGSSYAFNDGKSTTVLIEELRFIKYCERIQQILSDSFDLEFKLYAKQRGYNIDAGSYKLMFKPPTNFAGYKEADYQSTRISVFNDITQQPFISKRWAMKKYLGLEEDEILENERMWIEENPDRMKGVAAPQQGSPMPGLGSVGVEPFTDQDLGMGGMDDLDMGDMDMGPEMTPGTTGPGMGGEPGGVGTGEPGMVTGA